MKEVLIKRMLLMLIAMALSLNGVIGQAYTIDYKVMNSETIESKSQSSPEYTIDYEFRDPIANSGITKSTKTLFNRMSMTSTFFTSNGLPTSTIEIAIIEMAIIGSDDGILVSTNG